MDEQIRLLQSIDKTRSKLDQKLKSKSNQAKETQKSMLSSWSVHLNCIWNELCRQQNWLPESKLKRLIMHFFGKYLETTVKENIPTFSPLWNQTSYWPVPPKIVHYSTIYGFDLYTSGTDMWSVLATGHYRQETSESLLILRLLPEIELFIDVGANVGFYSLLAARASGKKVKTTAFEPALENRKTFLTAVNANKLNENITVLPYAVGSQIGTATLHHSALGSGGHRIEPVKTMPTSQTETVQTTTLNEIQKKYAPSYTSTLIKIDVEGFEHAVIEGGAEWLSHPQAPIILIEAWPEIAKSRSNHIKIVKKLKSFGYRVYPIMRAVNNKSPLGKACRPFLYKSPTGNYLALPPNKDHLYNLLWQPIDTRIFTNTEHLKNMFYFLNQSLASLKDI